MSTEREMAETIGGLLAENIGNAEMLQVGEQAALRDLIYTALRWPDHTRTILEIATADWRDDE